MLRVSAVSKSYGAAVVLRDISFTLGPGERAGLVGANGSGKTTLLRLIGGEIEPDTGSVWLDPADSVEYLPQYPEADLQLSVREVLVRAAGRAGVLERRITELEDAMPAASSSALEPLLEEYSKTVEEFEQLGGYGLSARIDEVVDGLGLQAVDLDNSVSSLSGGNKTKLSLARLLLSNARIRLLDEPTNYLDLPALLWLEEFVTRGDGSYIIVSHDRRFLDRTVSDILELDSITHTLRRWPGTYTEYADARQTEDRKRLDAYRDQQEQVAKIEEDIRRTKEQASTTEKRTKSGPGADYLRARAKKVASKAKARERRLDRLLDEQEIEKPKLGWNLHLTDLGRDPIADDRTVLEMQGVRASYGSHEVLRGVDLLLRGRDRVALVGENGSGKSTLVRCISGSVEHTGAVRLGPSVRLGLLSQEHEGLELETTVLDAFRSRTEMHESDSRAYLHKFLFKGDDVFKGVRSLSYGERSKLALAILVLSGANFLVLDEPTSHMDMPALNAIETTLAQYVGPLLVVSHDRAFLEEVGVTRVEAMADGKLHSLGSVEDYGAEVLSRTHARA
jgi:ATP-binding cassette subfamily F protein 3